VNERLSYLLSHSPAFPGLEISGSALNYPEFILFRATMIPGSTVMALFWASRYVAGRGSPRGARRRLGSTVLACLSALLLMMSAATLDTTGQTRRQHDFYAVSYFVLAILAYTVDSTLPSPTYYKRATVAGMYLAVLYLAVSRYPHRRVVSEYVGVHLLLGYNWMVAGEQEGVVLTLE
jgi:hypothetical protein